MNEREIKIHSHNSRGGIHPRPSALGEGRQGRGKPCPYSKLILFILLFIPIGMFAQTLPLLQQADSQYELSQYDSALVDFNQIVIQYPAKKEGYYNRGLAFYHLNKSADALRDFNTCLQTDSVFDDARFMKVLILQAKGDWEHAFIEFKKMNTNYTGYNELEKRIRYHNISVILSRNWYYMLAIMFMFILLVGIIVKSYYAIKG